MTVTDAGRLTYGCNPRARCASTQSAWNNGCRHLGAIAAHQVWLAAKKAQRAVGATWPPGVCLAVSHNTLYAAQRNGCICPSAIAKRDADRARKAEYKRNRTRQRDYSREFERDRARVRRATGGRLDSDPRRDWRYGKAGVSSITVMMLLHGFSDSPTRGERLAAIIRLDRERVRDEETARMRPMNITEIARRIGCAEPTVVRLRKMRVRLREQRHLRRLADARWRAAHHARGEARRPRP